LKKNKLQQLYRNNNNLFRFIAISDLVEGDNVILIDTSDPINVNFVTKQVKSLSNISKEFSGWIITVERRHLFLTVTDSNNTNLSYAAIEHNYYGQPCAPYTGFCGSPICGKGVYCQYMGDPYDNVVCTGGC
jgi:hypothetical protein